MTKINKNNQYLNYKDFKHWQNFFECSEIESTFYSKIFNKIAVQNINFLDVGFGYGSLLKWASLNNAKIFGVEIQEDLQVLARKQNISVFSDVLDIKNQKFEIITLIDVLEHLDFDHIVLYLDYIFKILNFEGSIIIKIPNCQSAAGLANQFGDPTHKTMLSGPILFKILSDIGYREVVYKSSPILESKILLFRLFRRLFSPFGFLFEIIFRLKYSNFSGPLTPDVVIYAKK